MAPGTAVAATAAGSGAAPRRLLPPLVAALLLAAPVPAAQAAAGMGTAAGPAPGIDCRCRANGRSYGLGERACIRTPEGPRLAECRMVQNVTSWATVGGPGEGGGCAVSRFLRPSQVGPAPGAVPAG